MGCGISRSETDEGGGEGEVTRKGSLGRDSEIASSFVSDNEMSTHSKRSKTDGEMSNKEEEENDEWENEEEDGYELKKCCASPSFRIYCVYPNDPNDDKVVDDDENHNMQRSKDLSDLNKEHKGRKQEAVGMKIRKRFNNVKKLLIPPTPPSSAPA